MGEHVEVDERNLRRLLAALRAEEDGKTLKREMVTELRAVAGPALEAARGAILSMGSKGESVPSLRTVVARQTKIAVRASGKHPGVMVRAVKTGMPRGFRNAPKRLNSKKGWRHPVPGGGTWVVQRGKPGWFDDTLNAAAPEARAAVSQVLDNVARRIDAKTKG